jgi:hypothetical protein
VPEPFSGLAGYIAVAVAAVIVSLFVLAIAAGRAREQKTRAVLQGLGFLGIAIAAPCLVQALALADGQGSPYAVKKYIFGLLTVLVIDACAVAAALVPRLGPGEDRSSRGSTRFAAVVALTAVAVLSIFSHQGARYSTSAITTLERHVNEVASAAHLQGNARGYAIGLPGDSPFWPGHDPMLDFMFSLSTFAAPNGSVGGDVYEGQPAFSVSEFVTGVGSQFDDPACRRFGPRDGLVVIGTVCWRDDEMACRSVTFLGQGGPPIELGGFSVPEHGGRWTDGTTATFTCYLPRSEGRKPVTLALDAIAFVPFKGSRQRVTLVANGEQKRYLLTREMWHATLRLTVPQSSSRRLHLTLNLPDAVSPKQLRISIDPRVIGLYIGRIRIG